MTNEEKERLVNEKLASMSPEDRERYIANEQQHDRNMCESLSREWNANIQVIPNDLHHILVNGEVYGYNEFDAWLREQKRNRRNQQRQQLTPSLNGGWFN